MNTMIISAFPATGKTYLYRNQDSLTFNYLGQDKRFSFKDSDSSHYTKTQDWQKQYVDDIKNLCGTVDFIFISNHEEVLKELESQHIPFVMVAPDNSEWISEKERRLIKQQYFGRFVLRDNSHIKDFNKWFNMMKEKYDDWTSVKHLTKYNPASFLLLKQDQYMSDIIKQLYQMKEQYPEIYCSNRGDR
jgi:hypothetical protein